MQKFPDRWALLSIEKNSSILENCVKNLKIVSELSVKDCSGGVSRCRRQWSAVSAELRKACPERSEGNAQIHLRKAGSGTLRKRTGLQPVLHGRRQADHD